MYKSLNYLTNNYVHASPLARDRPYITQTILTAALLNIVIKLVTTRKVTLTKVFKSNLRAVRLTEKVIGMLLNRKLRHRLI